MSRAAPPVDRRVRRTRQRLGEALLALIVERGYDDVTVQDLLDRADVGRTTFYAHYRDKDDLLVEGLRDLRTWLREHLHAAHARPGHARDRLLGFSRPMFEHAGEQRALFRAIAGRRAGVIVLAQVRKIFAELVREDVAALAPRGTDVPIDAAVEFTVGALLSVLTWWLEHRTGLEPAEADALFRRLALPGLTAALR